MNVTKLLFLLFLAVCSISCSNTEVFEGAIPQIPTKTRQAISLKIYMPEFSRAATIVTPEDLGDFNVTAFRTDSTFYFTETCSPDKAADIFYWPEPEDSLDAALSFYAANVNPSLGYTDNGDGTIRVVDENGEFDFVTAITEHATNEITNDVTLEFAHQLSQVAINVAAPDSILWYEVTDLSITNATRATYVFAPTVELPMIGFTDIHQDSIMAKTFGVDEPVKVDVGGKSIGENKFLIPNTGGTLSISYSIYANNNGEKGYLMASYTKTADILSTLTAGSNNLYSIELSGNQINLTYSVSPWGAATNVNSSINE